MIKDISVHVKPKNKNGMIAFLSSLTIGAFLFVYSSTLEMYRGVFGLVALAFMVYALYAFTKYVCREYCYDITGEDEPMLVVRQLVGKRSTAMCRVLLSDISEVKFENKEQRAIHKTERDFMKYSYTVTMGVSDTVRLTVKNRYEKCEIVLEGTAELANMLGALASEARAQIPVDYEE